MAWLRSSPLADYLMASIDNIQKALDNEQATRDATLVRLAEEIYEREHGAPPKTLGELVGPLLDRLPDRYAADDPVELPATAGAPAKRP
jgi:hypothetical protein